MITISELHAKSILTPTKLPGSDYVINAYSGCLFGCVYCYADFTRKFTGHLDDEWGEYADVKVNSPELLVKELDRILVNIKNKKGKFKTGPLPVIFMSSVTDPYMPIERKYKLTRKILEILVDREVPAEISILTKSPLVLRDIDLLRRLKNVSVGLTITSTDDAVSQLFEKGAPPATERIKALRELNKNGIETYAFVGPLLPHFVAELENLDKLFKEISESGNKTVWVEHLNLSGMKKERLLRLVGDKLGEDVRVTFENSQTEEYKQKLNDIVKGLVSKYDLVLVGGDVIDHQKL